MKPAGHYIKERGLFVKKPEDCEEFTASDGCRIRELLHGKNDPVDLPYSIALARVEAGGRTYRHRLDRTEVYFILSGRGRLHAESEARELELGQAAIIPPGSAQWIENTGAEELRFLALVSPPWSEEGDERLE
jgi:mannose-6-phosphate isomerase-like protein (cupin superfamily)